MFTKPYLFMLPVLLLTQPLLGSQAPVIIDSSEQTARNNINRQALTQEEFDRYLRLNGDLVRDHMDPRLSEAYCNGKIAEGERISSDHHGIELPISEIEELYKKDHIIYHRLPKHKILVIGCGNYLSSNQHGHEGQDTWDLRYTVNPSFVGEFGRDPLGDTFKNRQYDTIIGEGLALFNIIKRSINTEGSHVIRNLLELLSPRGVVGEISYIQHLSTQEALIERGLISKSQLESMQKDPSYVFSPIREMFTPDQKDHFYTTIRRGSEPEGYCKDLKEFMDVYHVTQEEIIEDLRAWDNAKSSQKEPYDQEAYLEKLITKGWTQVERVFLSKSFKYKSYGNFS